MALIHEKLIAVMRSVTAIGKTQKNEQQKFYFRGIDQVMNELHGLFADNGVFVCPEINGPFDVTEHTNAKGTSIFRCRVPYRFTFYAEDGSSVVSSVVGEAMDSGDKGMNKAISVALKYALLQTLLIPTEDEKDPDSESHDIKNPDYIEAMLIAERLDDKKAKEYLEQNIGNIANIRVALSRLKKKEEATYGAAN